MTASADDKGPTRTCIVTRRERSPDEMIRFVLAPDGTATPDLRRKLPGRGVWVTATAANVAEAVKKRAFERGFKGKAKPPDGLVALIDRLLEAECLQGLSLANKAGLVVTGFAKVEAAIAAGDILAALHASDGGADGKRKIGQALKRRFGATPPPELETFDSGQLDLALGRANVIHAALLAGDAGKAALKRMVALDRYRGGSPDKTATVAAVAHDDVAAEDTE